MTTNFPTAPKCDVHGCGKPQVARGLCETHYKRLKRHGTTSDEVGKKTIDGVLLSKHPLYEAWRSITKSDGGRLICPEWKDFATFVKAAGVKPDGAYALKRIDTNGLFEPGNVRWAIRVANEGKLRDNADKMRDWSAKKREANPDYYRDYDLRKKYRITIVDYNKMLSEQNGVCAICGNPETRVDKRLNRVSNLAVDHCHETGKIRGLLCHACNAMLGQSGDSADRLRLGAAYLDRVDYCTTPPDSVI
jgi:hypothetical protein